MTEIRRRVRKRGEKQVSINPVVKVIIGVRQIQSKALTKLKIKKPKALRDYLVG